MSSHPAIAAGSIAPPASFGCASAEDGFFLIFVGSWDRTQGVFRYPHVRGIPAPWGSWRSAWGSAERAPWGAWGVRKGPRSKRCRGAVRGGHDARQIFGRFDLGSPGSNTHRCPVLTNASSLRLAFSFSASVGFSESKRVRAASMTESPPARPDQLDKINSTPDSRVSYVVIMVNLEGSDVGSGLLEVVQAHDRIAWLTVEQDHRSRPRSQPGGAVNIV